MKNAIHEITKQGYTIIPDFVDNDTVNRLRELCDSLRPSRGFVKQAWTWANHNKLPWLYYYTVQINNDNNDVQTLKDKIHDVCNEFIGPFDYRATDFIVNYPNSESINVRPHIDTPYRFKEFEGGHNLALQIALVIDEFTKENGGTGYVPGSHELKFEYYKGDQQVNVEKISNFWEHNHRQYCAKPGTLILWDARMLHSTMPNYTDEKRRMLLINAVSQTIRDRVNELDPIWSRDAKMLN